MGNSQQAEFFESIDVSRETKERLVKYVALVEKWNPKINLVSKKSIIDIWTRHVADSAQIYRYGNTTGHWVDLGSGGGFPGIVVAILASEAGNQQKVTLVESDKRKSAFLRAAAREVDVKVDVISERIEDIQSLEADILSARALASLDVLIGFASNHLKAAGIALFPKGVTHAEEVRAAQRNWNFELEEFPSKSDTSAVILKIGEIKNA